MCRPTDFPPFDHSAGGSAVAYIASVRAATPLDPVMVAFCRCGERAYPSMAEARAAEPDGAHKCPHCNTFASDHYWRGDEASDWRCWDCDVRSGSHGGPR